MSLTPSEKVTFIIHGSTTDSTSIKVRAIHRQLAVLLRYFYAKHLQFHCFLLLPNHNNAFSGVLTTVHGPRHQPYPGHDVDRLRQSKQYSVLRHPLRLSRSPGLFSDRDPLHGRLLRQTQLKVHELCPVGSSAATGLHAGSPGAVESVDQFFGCQSDLREYVWRYEEYSVVSVWPVEDGLCGLLSQRCAAAGCGDGRLSGGQCHAAVFSRWRQQSEWKYRCVVTLFLVAGHCWVLVVDQKRSLRVKWGLFCTEISTQKSGPVKLTQLAHQGRILIRGLISLHYSLDLLVWFLKYHFKGHLQNACKNISETRVPSWKLQKLLSSPKSVRLENSPKQQGQIYFGVWLVNYLSRRQ